MPLLVNSSPNRWYALWRYHFRYCRVGHLRAERDIVSFLQFTLGNELKFPIYSENRDKVEMYLAFGASRFEACKPIATEALRLALTPNINQMR